MHPPASTLLRLSWTAASESRMTGPEVIFTVSPKQTVVFLERKGAYSGVGEAMMKLKKWADSNHIAQVGRPFCLYFDNPMETPEAELRSEVCIPIAKAVQGEGQFKVKELAETQVAETKHVGPPEKFAETYGPFLEGLLKSGYRLLGPAREYYLSAKEVTGPGAGILIQQPIAPKK